MDNVKLKEILRATASKDKDVSQKAMDKLISIFEDEYRKAMAEVNDIKQGKSTAQFSELTPLRRALFREDLIGNIYTRVPLDAGSSARFPLDFVAEGEQDDFSAFLMPKQGRIPENHIEGDEIYVPTFRVANSIDWDIAYARDARWDVVRRAMEVFRSGIVKRSNDDGWHTILAAGFGNGEMINDAAAAAGRFTKELVSKIKTRQRRRALGGTLTDLYVSPEAFEDIRTWDIDDIDEITRREIFADDRIHNASPMIVIYGVRVHDMRELGISQEYQDFFITTLGGSLAGGGDVELVVGLDLSREDSFVQPIRAELSIHEDETLRRQGRQGVFGDLEHGLAILDDRRVVLGSF